MCVKPNGMQRPTISEVLKEIQQAIAVERAFRQEQTLSNRTTDSATNADILNMATSYQNIFSPELFAQPGLR